MKKNHEIVASGIDALVEKLRREGVDAANQESEQILNHAKQQAQTIIAEAKELAQRELQASQQQLSLERKAAEDALKIAYRDLVLELKSHLLNRFSDDVERLVTTSVQDPDVVKKLVLAAAGRMVEESEITPESELEIVLPPEILPLDEITKDPQNAAKGPIADFVFSVQGQLLRDGISFSVGDEAQSGITIKLVDEKIEVDLTDQAISQLLLSYLNPRFRAVLDGIVH